MTRKETTQCEKCGKTVELNSMKPVFKKEFAKADGRPDIPLDILLGGGWLGKTLEGMACPNCGEILARTTLSSSRKAGGRRRRKRTWLPNKA
jgi:predicted RNA-binding Zn-ribbon protein involved in translation (DUF1610 family)